MGNNIDKIALNYGCVAIFNKNGQMTRQNAASFNNVLFLNNNFYPF